jgi:SAM-dependent methyltransferase
VSPDILELARDLGVQGTYALLDSTGLPFGQQFDVIYAFSVFTHLSETAHQHALAVWRNSLALNGLVAVSVRPRYYWSQRKHPLADDLVRSHDAAGFAFATHGHGDEYGDASISPKHVGRWSGWRLVGVDMNNADPLQVVLYLQPRRP